MLKKIDTCNVERTLELISLLETLPRDKFNMRELWCETSGCICGWAVQHFGTAAERRDEGLIMWDAGKAALGIKNELVARALFQPWWYGLCTDRDLSEQYLSVQSATPAEAITALRALAAGGTTRRELWSHMLLSPVG